MTHKHSGRRHSKDKKRRRSRSSARSYRRHKKNTYSGSQK